MSVYNKRHYTDFFIFIVIGFAIFLQYSHTVTAGQAQVFA